MMSTIGSISLMTLLIFAFEMPVTINNSIPNGGVDKPIIMVQGKRILITGAGGSIGSEICRQLKSFGPSQLLLLDIDETELHNLSLELHQYQQEFSPDIFPICCDIKNKEKIDEVFKTFKPQIVFHVAQRKMGIWEPIDGEIVTPTASSVILVPGMAFTREGLRLGRGKGYYDRYLARYPKAITIGVCRSYQLVGELPSEAWQSPEPTEPSKSFSFFSSSFRAEPVCKSFFYLH